MNKEPYVLFVSPKGFACALNRQYKICESIFNLKLAKRIISENLFVKSCDTYFESWSKSQPDAARRIKYFHARECGDGAQADFITYWLPCPYTSEALDLKKLDSEIPLNWGDIKSRLSERHAKALEFCKKERRRNREFKQYFKGFFYGGGRDIAVWSGDEEVYLGHGECYALKDLKYALEDARGSRHWSDSEETKVSIWSDIYGYTNEGEYSESERVDCEEASYDINLIVKDGKFYEEK